MARSKRNKKPVVEREFTQRVDGNVNVWERTMGKYDWTEWSIVKVLCHERKKRHERQA